MAQTAGSTVVIGVFEDRPQAENAADELRREGYSERQLGFACPDDKGDTEVVSKPGAEPEPGTHAGAGITSGGVLGGALGAAATGLIPGVGPIVAVGALTGVLGGAAIGGAAGGFAAVMKDMGVDEQVAQSCEEELRAGRSLVTVQTSEDPDAVRAVLRRNDVLDIKSNQTGG